MRLSIGAMAAKIPVILALTRGLGMGVEALPLSHAITVTGECVFLTWFLRDRVRGRGLVGAHVRIAVASAALGITAYTLAPRLPVVLVCAIAGATYLATAYALGLRDLGIRALRRDPGLPPSVDTATKEALEALAGGSVRVDGERLSCPRGSWRIVAKEGVLSLVADGGAEGGPLSGEVFAVLRPGAPPTLRGIRIGERSWYAEGDRIVEGECAGPSIPVRAAS
jgi:hypothetical protein